MKQDLKHFFNHFLTPVLCTLVLSVTHVVNIHILDTYCSGFEEWSEKYKGEENPNRIHTLIRQSCIPSRKKGRKVTL